jgi:peptidoglycan-associated lipoprotein
MRRNYWIVLTLLVVLPGLLMTVSCAKKTVQTESAVTQPATDEDAQARARQEAQRQAELEAQRKAEMERQRALEAERLRQQQMAESERQARMQANRFQSEYIYFEFDSSALLFEAQEILKQKAAYLRQNPNVRITIEGHCDERGTNEYNLALGDRRANSAKSFLVDLGISASRMTTISYGEERPLDLGHNEEAWAKNRRAQFVIE